MLVNWLKSIITTINFESEYGLYRKNMQRYSVTHSRNFREIEATQAIKTIGILTEMINKQLIFHYSLTGELEYLGICRLTR